MSETTHRLSVAATNEVGRWERGVDNYIEARACVAALRRWLDEGPEPIDERVAANMESLCQRLGYWP